MATIQTRKASLWIPRYGLCPRSSTGRRAGRPATSWTSDPARTSPPATSPAPSAIPCPRSQGPTTGTSRLVADLPSIFLPPRHEALLVVCGPDAPAAAVARHLEGRGRPEVTVLALGAADIAALPPAYRAVGPACGHLWSAPPWLVRHASLLPPPAAGPVLDLACGSARAVVWLAARGYRVTGLDWQPEALALGRQLAASRGCLVSARGSRPAGPGAGSGRTVGRRPQLPVPAAGAAGTDTVVCCSPAVWP